MYKIINLTPEKNATRSVGDYVSHVLGDSTSTSYYAKSYNVLSESDWLNFDKLIDESVVFMFVRNPYNRLVSSFIHTCLSLDYVLDFPEWYFDLPINKENQLKCFKNFCLIFAKKGINNEHISLQTDVINLHVNFVLNNSNFSIIPYIENEIKENQASVQSITRHTFGLFTGIKGSKYWKRYLNNIKFMKDNVKNIILNGIENINE